MNHSATLANLISGNAHHTTSVDQAVEKRFIEIREQGPLLSPVLVGHRDIGSGYCYDGNRTEPENLGWRFAQYYDHITSEEIASGEYDEAVIWTYHEAASSEYYYRYEKDWGF